MKITASGMELEVPAGSTVETLLNILGETVRQDMIVELNRRFIHVRDYSTTIVNEGDMVEMIHLSFGG
ncbi:MAG: sulfur carrier protein ThiS [Syntrophobacteraceae bacterium]|jgi:thiamine biosynthesis protein ThiS